jgi:DNA-binding LacI/PurR family transcriptional regulator
LALSRRVDGLFLNEIRIEDPRIEDLALSGLPVVGINPPHTGFPFPAVHQDGTAAIDALVQVLANLGHRRLAHVSGPDGYVHSRDRVTAWVAAAHAAGLTADVIIEGDFTLEGGRRAAEAVLRHRPLPTAVFCANDLTAVGFINRILEQGLRVPEDISVAGFDGISLGDYLRPTLTTIRTDPRGLGRQAARTLLDAIDGGQPDDEWIPAAALQLRDSIATAPAPDHSRYS